MWNWCFLFPCHGSICMERIPSCLSSSLSHIGDSAFQCTGGSSHTALYLVDQALEADERIKEKKIINQIFIKNR